MGIAWADYWLLDVVSTHSMSLQRLLHPELAQAFNRPGHHLHRWELVDAVDRLFARGELVALRNGPAPRPTRAELDQALRWSGPPYRGGLAYELSPRGGERWERLTGADWSRYVRAYRTHAGDSVTGTIEGQDRERVARRLAAEASAEEVVWERLQPYRPTSWKSLPGGWRVRYRCRREPAPAFHPTPTWRSTPRFEQGAIYRVPLDGSARPETGWVRVLAREHGHRFLAALSWGGPGVQAPPHWAAPGREFMTSSAGQGRGEVLGRWWQGPLPEPWRFCGVVEVDDAERALARSTAAVGDVVDALRTERAWRRSPRACQDPDAPARHAGLAAHLVSLRAPAVTRAWEERYARYDLGAGTWQRRLQRAFDGLPLREPRPRVTVEALSTHGLAFDLRVSFAPGPEPYCCAEPGCHLGLHDRRGWDLLRADLSRCPPLEVRAVHVEVEAGARFLRPSHGAGASGWAEAETLHSRPTCSNRRAELDPSTRSA